MDTDREASRRQLFTEIVGPIRVEHLLVTIKWDRVSALERRACCFHRPAQRLDLFQTA